MLEMTVNPLSGAGKSMAKSLVKYGIRRFGKDALGSAGGRIARVATRLAGDVTGAAGMAATTGGAGVIANAEHRMTGNIKHEYNPETGMVEYAGREGDEKSYGTALLKSAGARTIENFSEMAGNYFGPIFGKVGNAVGKSKAVAVITRLPGLAQTKKALEQVGNTDWAKGLDRYMKAAQWQGSVGEYFEEVLGSALNSIFVGDESLSNIVDRERQIDTFLSVAMMGGAFSAIRTMGYRTPQYSARRDMERADRRGENMLGKRWEELRSVIDSADDLQLPAR
jgi:hypothetical protein